MTSSNPLWIAVLGTHSTGKTTLLRRIEMELRGHGLTVARTGRLGKRAATAGLPKMQHHTAQSTEWIIAQGILDETNAAAQGAEVVLIDRAAHDAVAYFEAAMAFRAETPTRLERERLLALASTQLAGAAGEIAVDAVRLARVLNTAVMKGADEFDEGAGCPLRVLFDVLGH
ncbi:AAA family ATPase [Streptomyces anthocyanicus]|uniref:AAA family ATPase n=1 Tax=Streptomyces anthocyanicus TaxID=68174 RepID=UPI00386B44DF|nr:ATP-binding protein [Streptomyces anthocyanicus]